MSEEIRQLIRRYTEEAVNNGRHEVIPEFFHQDITYYDPFVAGGEGHGTEAMTQFMVATKKAFPDFRFTVEDVFVDGDVAGWRGFADGTHEGEFPGLPAPTGRKIHVPMCQVMRIQDGKIKEMHVFTDSFKLAQQVGAFG